MLHTRKPQTEEALRAMEARNAARQQIARRVLGEKYAHHRTQHVRRLDTPAVVLVMSSRAAMHAAIRGNACQVPRFQ